MTQEIMQHDEALAVARIESGSVEMVGGMLKAIIDKGVTVENVTAVDKLVELFERMDAKRAEREFCKAFAALQAEMPAVEATKAVPNDNGTTRYKYAPIEQIMKQVKPFLATHGFAIRFSEKPITEGRITMICTLMHKDGHSISNEYSCRIGNGPPKSSESQADGSASSYAQRGALCDCLNITTFRIDDDARNLGKPITKEQAEDLRRRVQATASNEKDFLAFAQAAGYEHIMNSDYARLDASLRRKESTK
jgi:hypothetical protein